MSKKTILNSTRLGALTMLGCAVLLTAGGVAQALPTDRSLDPHIECPACVDEPQPGPSTRPPVRDPFTGRLVDKPDRWVLRGPVVIPPY